VFTQNAGTSPTNIEWLDGGSNSNYNALQISLDKKFSRGLTFHLAYTWSKSLTQVSDFEAGLRGTQDRYNRAAEWGYWDNDAPHRFVASFTYQIPVGQGHSFNPSSTVVRKILERWQVNGLVTYASGQPLSIGIPYDFSGTGSGNRPDCTGLTTSGFDQTIDHWIDPARYSIPSPDEVVVSNFHFGNCSATPGPRAPGISLWDMSLFKQIPVTETKQFQFRVEAFNIWNKPQFGAPDTNVGHSSFGSISSLASPARQVQLALKFFF
jgi:hypothetical protein